MRMKNEYKWSFSGTCPVNGRSDTYWATLEKEGFVEVETLLKFCADRETEPIFQEDWTKMLCEEFGGKVTLMGHHHGGVRIQSICEP